VKALSPKSPGVCVGQALSGWLCCGMVAGEGVTSHRQVSWEFMPLRVGLESQW
jgi:hypothetical protein